MEERRDPARRRPLTEADQARVDEVFRTHRSLIENVARRHAIHEDAVPDIVQAVGLQLCRGLHGFRGEARISTWLFRVTVNEARTHYKRENKHQLAAEAIQSGSQEPDQIIDPDQEVILGQRLEQLRHAVARLRPIHRDAIRHEIGNQRGEGVIQSDEQLKPETRKTRRHRARQALRRMMLDVG